MTDKRIVKMQDLVAALAKEWIHAVDCPDRVAGIRTMSINPSFCNCWVNPEQEIALMVNG